MLDNQELNKFISDALREDVHEGDHSSLASIDKDAQGKARLLVKDNGILCGMEVAKAVFAKVDADLRVDVHIPEGSTIKYGDVAFHVYGSAISILTAERLVLNCMQRMSGIATKTNEYVQAISGTHTKVIDTRKTTPNLRFLEKYAVTVGGGYNHRFGLYDMIMLKDNHIDYAGGLANAIEKAYEYVTTKKPSLKIEVETRSIEDVQTVCSIGKGKVFRIMLDNFNPEQIFEAVKIIDGNFDNYIFAKLICHLLYF